MQPLSSQYSLPQLHGVRGSLKPLPPIKGALGNRVNTQQQSQSEHSNVPIKVKIKKGYQMAEYTKAVEYFHSQSYVRKIIGPDGNPDYQPYQICTDTQDLKHYGLGVYLYLQFVKRLAVTLLVMSAILIVPIIYSYMNGKGMEKYTQSYMIILAESSLGNLKDADQTSYMMYTVCDILAMIVLFFFYLHWRSFHSEAVDAQAKDVKIINPTNYVLSVVGFDPSTPNLEKNLITYFDQVFSGAYEVEVINDYNGKFSKFIHYDELVEKRQKQKQVMIQTGKSNQDFLAIQRQITEFQNQLCNIAQVFEPKQAIIHFRTLKAKYNYMNFCKKYSLIDKFSYNFKRFICCQHLPPQSQLFLGKNALMIKSNSLSRPEHINWNNLDVSKCSRVIRWIFSILFLIICILITTSLIALCTLYVSSTSSCSNFDPNVIVTVAQAQAKGSQAVYCFCANHFTQIYTNPIFNQACGSLSNTILYSNLMQVGASLVSSISNIILILAVGVIAKYILKPDSKPKQYSFIFVSVLISNYINASILPLIMNGDIFGFQSLTYLKFMSFIDFNNVAIFKDYDRDWYAIVAPYYITFLIIAMISPIINYFTTCMFSCWTSWRLKSTCQNNDVRDPLIQKQANLRITSTMFDLSVQQAIVVLNLFITLMYSSLLPILIPITTLYLISTFLFKKAIILRYSIRVPADHDLSQKTITLIPFMILLHFLMGIWGHTADGFFNSDSYIIKNSFSFIGGSFDRIFKDLLLLGALVVILAWIIFDYTIISFFGLLQECCSKDEMQTPKQFATLQNKPYQQYVKSANVLESYKLTKNPDFGHALKAYQQLKNKKKKQSMKKTLRDQQRFLSETNSPNKFGQHTVDSINIRNNEQINLNPQN